MVRVPLILAGLLGRSLLPCEGISTNPRDVWKKLTLEEHLGEAQSEGRVEEALRQPEECADAQPGDDCHRLVAWSLEKGLTDHPEWFVTFKKSALKERNSRAMQEILYSKGKAGCSKPCFTDPTPVAEVQETPDADVQEEAKPAEVPAAAAEEAKPQAAPAAPAGEAKPHEAAEPAAGWKWWKWGGKRQQGAKKPEAALSNPAMEALERRSDALERSSAPAPAASTEGATPGAAAAAPAAEAKPAEAPAPAAEERAAPANGCLDAVPGDHCHELVTFVIEKAVKKHPEWFPMFSSANSDELNFKLIQGALHDRGKHCSKPCVAA